MVVEVRSESETLTAQEQAVQTKHKAKKILQTEKANAASLNNLIRQWNIQGC